jgi:hypothetical protein
MYFAVLSGVLSRIFSSIWVLNASQFVWLLCSFGGFWCYVYWWWRSLACDPTVDAPLPLGSRIVSGISSHLLTATAHNDWTPAVPWLQLSQCQSYFTTGSLPPINSPWRQAPWEPRPVILFFQLNACAYSPYVTSSLMRGWVCRLQLLLPLARAVILRSESPRTHDHILSQIRDSPNLEGRVPIFISPRHGWPGYTPRH